VIAVYIVLGFALGITVLVMLVLIAGVLVALLYEIVPIVRAWDVNLSAPLWVTKWQAVALPLQPVVVALCRQPVKDAEYFHEVAHGLPMFTKRKSQAKTFDLADRMAIAAFFRKYGEDVFIVYVQQK